jgi:hypothetical protein
MLEHEANADISIRLRDYNKLTERLSFMGEEYHIAIFRKKEIRKQLHSGEWWFVVSGYYCCLDGF